MNKHSEKNNSFFIKPLKLIFFITVILILSVITINIFFRSVKTKESQTFYEKDSRIFFLENVIIREGGLYTLLGTKPITEFDIEGTIEETEDDFRQNYGSLKAFIEKSEKELALTEEKRTSFNPKSETLPPYESYRSKCIERRDSLKSLNHKRLWEEYKEKQIALDPKFCILSRKSPYGEGSIGLFVNIPNLIYILYHYREEFTERLHRDFEPNEVISQINDEDSMFWNAVFKDHFLSGLIYGYGERSSYLFNWSGKYLQSVSEERRAFFSNEERLKKSANLITNYHIKPSDLPIPDFFYFGVSDPKGLEYEIEREKILEHFNNKNFCLEVMKVLAGSNG